VSPISAWTSGWDMPDESTKPAEPAPAAPAGPRRSELLAAKLAQNTTQDAPQDWGVSLGATSRNRVADPGWGAPASAPDWAQAPAATDPDAVGTTVAPADGPVPAGASNATSGEPPSSGTAAAATPAAPAAPHTGGGTDVSGAPASSVESGQQPGGAKLSMYQRLSHSAEATAHRPAATTANAPQVEDVPSEDDVTIEESGVVGQAAVERILGGQLIEERDLNAGR